MSFEAVFFVTICCAERTATGGLCQQPVFDILRQTAQVHADKGRLVSASRRTHAGSPARVDPVRPRGLDAYDRIRVFAVRWRHAGVHWQRDFFDHRIRDNEDLREKREYILANPVRKGLVKTG